MLIELTEFGRGWISDTPIRNQIRDFCQDFFSFVFVCLLFYYFYDFYLCLMSLIVVVLIILLCYDICMI